MKKRVLALLLVAGLLAGFIVPAALAARTDETPEIPAEEGVGNHALSALEDQPIQLAAGEEVNLARLDGVTATDSNHEMNTHVTPNVPLDGSQTIDGVKAIPADDTTNGHPNGHWSTEQNPGTVTLTVDLNRICRISEIKLFWKHNSVTAYTLELSSDGTAWNNVKTQAERVELEQTVTPDQPAEDIRYVKLKVTACDNQGTATWANVNLWEIEIYGTVTREIVTPAGFLNGLTFQVDGNGKLVPGKEIPEGFTVTYAANLEQVVGADHTVYTPLVDTVVELDVTVSDGTSSASTPANAPIAVTIPGIHSANEGNPKPAVIPEMMEWYSSADQRGQKFTLTENSRIVAPAGLAAVANEVKGDVQALFGLELLVISGTPRAGDVVLTLGTGSQVAGFDDETYTMEVTDRVNVTAKADQGVYWGTRSVLQALKLSGDMTIAQGTAKDYPEFRLRGFMLDVGRKPMSMDMLTVFAKNMAWYKLNDFHIHLNDNLIFMEDYLGGENPNGDQVSDVTWTLINDQAYSAFRLESSLQEEPDAVAPLAARDYHYSKDEFRQFVSDSASLGINVVPEIDVPAHAKAIADAFPSIRLRGQTKNRHPTNCHLDLSEEKYDETLRIVKSIFDDYIDQDGFLGAATVDFGTDEYYDTRYSANFRRFSKDLAEYIKGEGLTPRLWGSTGSDPGVLAGASEGVQMSIWETGAANPQVMYNSGFQLINIHYNPAYVVPSGSGSRGSYGDRLDMEAVDTWTPNKISGTWFPASSEQMLGGAYAVWQDNIDTRAAGIDEVDTFDRFFEGLPLYSERMWGASRTMANIQAVSETTGTAPGTNPTNELERKPGTSKYFSYDFETTADRSGNDRTLTLSGARLVDGALELSGGASCAETGMDKMGWGNQLTFRAKKTSGGGAEQILFETDHLSDGRNQPYNEYAIKALPVNGDNTKWKLGFSRELYDYEFDMELPVGEWVKLTLVTGEGITKLYVDDSAAGVSAVGKFVAKANSNTQFRGKTGITHASFQMPIARIGSRTNSFVGLIDDVYAVPASAATPLDGGDYDIPVEEYQGALAGNQHGDGESAAKAIDGESSTIWHTRYDAGNQVCPEEDGWIQIELKERQPVAGLRYLPRTSGGTNGIIRSFDILVSDNGQDWTRVVENGSFTGTSGWQTASFPATEAKYVRLLARETLSDANCRYVTAAEVRLCRPIDLSEAGKTTVVFDREEYPLQGNRVEPEPEVSYDGQELSPERDYTLAYANNTAAGTATLTITGKGAYTGSVSVSFTIVEVKIDLSAASVTLAKSSYPLVNGKAEPEPVVTLGGTALVKGTDYTVSYSGNTAAGTARVTVTGIGRYTGTAGVSFTVTASSEEGPKPSGGGSAANLTTAETRSDGSTLKTTTDRRSGTVTGDARYPDGTVVTSQTTAGGITTATVTLGEEAESATVIIYTGDTPSLGQVAVVIHPDGTREVLKTSLPTEEGLSVTVSENTRVQIVDNTRHFKDVSDSYWGRDAITFVTSREIFNGTGSDTFSPNASMSRAMVCTVLANLEGQDVRGGKTWYERAVQWAQGQKISDGSNPNAIVTREQLVSMLYRYAGSPATSGELKGYSDLGRVSSWAAIPMSWAIQTGLINGRADGRLDPAAGATRAEVAAVLQRYLTRTAK